MVTGGKARSLAEVGLLAALITVTGAVKLPGLLPGTEFQLSAPLAVAICVAFGFKRYLAAGLLSSLLGLVLGTQNLLNVYVSMVFRLTVGLVIGLGGRHWLVASLAGPLGSAAARMGLGLWVGKAVYPLLVAALPGMAYTALAAWPLSRLLARVRRMNGRETEHVLQR